MDTETTNDSVQEVTQPRDTGDLKIIENRLRTFSNWPIEFISPQSLAQAGFYYLKSNDLVKCAFCGGIIGQWEVNDEPLNEHRKFFPDCPIVVRSTIDEQDDEEIGIEIRMPKSPEFSTLESRVRSFATWNRSIQDPDVLSQAGFFFLNVEDEVRCFYCNGGLRNWLQSDDPWFEHTRWFPKCPYVMLVKGSTFIKNVLQRSEGSNQLSGTANQSLPPAPTISIEDAMGTQPALDALAMGLNAGRVRLVMQRKITHTGRAFTSTEALVSAVLDGQIEDEGFESIESDRRLESQVTQLLLSAVSSVGLSNDDSEQPSTSSCSGTVRTTSSTQHSVSEIPVNIENSPKLPANEEEARRMKNVECKICMAEEVGVVFLPCGHLLSCVMCAPAMQQCPLCRQVIRGRVRTFLS